MEKLERKWARIALLIFAAAMVCVILGAVYVSKTYLYPALALIAAAFVVSLAKLKCPYCGAIVRPQWKGNGTFRCTKCGSKIYYDK